MRNEALDGVGSMILPSLHRAVIFWGICGVVAALICPTVSFAQNSDQDTVAVTPQVTSEPSGSTLHLDTADLAIPTAQEVIVDLPSAFHASRYQRGEINGLRYVLYPDGSGKIMQAYDLRTVLFRLNCTSDISCIITDVGGSSVVVPAVNGPKPVMPLAPDGIGLARYLAEWLLAGTGEAVASPEGKSTAEEPMGVGIKVTSPEPQPQEITRGDNKAESDLVESQHQKTPAPVSKRAASSCVGQGAGLSTLCAKQPKPALKRQVAKRKPSRKTSVAVRALAKPIVPTSVVSRLENTKDARERETFFQRIKLACSITGSVTLRYKNHSSGSERFGKPRASFGCGAKLTDKLSLRLSVIGYGDKNEKSPSDAEFTYALSYRATDKITLSYSNYSARFDNSGSAFVDSLASGTLRASYKLPKIKLPNDKTIGCSASLGLPDPRDTTANLTCSYAVTDRLRISGTAYAYFSGQQENWDPDFAYTASYRINDDWSLSYSNYANNRFVWNKSSSPGEGILGGTVSLSYKFKF